MLQKLTINNYALIDSLEISFDAGLNILTGETGAGKSIILGALSLILGQRAESRYFFNQQKKCVIEGQFMVDGFHLKDFFEENDLDYEKETVLRREISIDGKSRAFVNDTPVTLAIIKQLGEKLIDIHSQHATLEINDPDFQLLVVDAVADHGSVQDEYRKSYKQWRALIAQLKQLAEESEQAKADLDYYQYQFDELDQAALDADEQAPLEQELYTLNNAEDIKRNLLGAVYLLQDGEAAVVAQLKDAGQQLGALEKFNPQIEELNTRLTSSLIELKDIAAEIEAIEQRTFTDDARVTEINERLSLIYNLQKKHRVSSNAELLTLQNELSEKIQKAVFSDEAIEKLQKEIAQQKQQVDELAAKLSAKRISAVPQIEEQVSHALSQMGMPNARLSIQVKPLPEPARSGADAITFLFSANKGHAPGEISKVASGGELSRIMLSIKSIIAKHTALPTIIFDEIDTGVSGEVAHKVGLIMEAMAADMQVITITHLPQMASKGQRHFFVYKDHDSEMSNTRIKQLTDDERVVEIAKMLSGDNPGESAMQNARELLGS